MFDMLIFLDYIRVVDNDYIFLDYIKVFDMLISSGLHKSVLYCLFLLHSIRVFDTVYSF